MFGIYNLISLVLGLAAVLLPVIALFFKRNPLFSYLSMTAGSISLCSQIAAYNTLVNKSDWSALLDTSDFTLSAALLLMVITAILNLILLLKRK